MINRVLDIEAFIKPGRTVLLFGARRVGKTTLVKNYLSELDNRNYASFNGDRYDLREKFQPENFAKLKDDIGDLDVIAIDEAQNIQNIGETLKLINDEMPNISVIATGSSSFDLREQVGEPLVGRKKTIILYPLYLGELKDRFTQGRDLLKQAMIYGLYPNAVTEESNSDKEDFLYELVDSLLLKDILAYKDVKSPEIIYQLLRLLAFQIGSEVSINEIGTKLGLHKDTVKRYLDLLEKSFIITKLGAYSSNLRNEVTKKPKYYFNDLGVRNAIIRNFSTFENRDDNGALWENLMIIERLKWRSYEQKNASNYFWRDYNKQEIDLIEERNGKLTAYEFKWSAKKQAKPPVSFTKAYPDAKFICVNRENFRVLTPF